MRCFRRILEVCLIVICWAGLAHAEGVSAIRATGVVTSSGQIALSTRFRVQLPDQLRQALLQGVPLMFELSYDLVDPTLPSYKTKINQWFDSSNTVNFRLSYHPLTGQYRVSVGTYSGDYSSLDAALRGVGAIAGWSVLPENTLSDYEVGDIKMNVRLQLSTRQLPKPFQINAITSRDWSISSGWVPLRLSRK